VTSGLPRPGTPVPARVRALAGGDEVRPLWVNQRGGVTFEIGGPGRRRFVKWAPRGSGSLLPAEAARLAWAGAFIAVPPVLAWGGDPAAWWMVSGALAGQMAVTARWKAEPQTAVTAIGEGLRAMHERLPAGRCPFSWEAGPRLRDIHDRARRGFLDPAQWHPEHRGLSVEAALCLLADVPPADRLVVCHGDACAPNTLLDGEGRCSGHVDLGALGVADRWADLAVATWSVGWNFGPDWETTLLDAYGVAADPDRTRYYRLLYDLGP
jgi:kanamycin kinase